MSQSEEISLFPMVYWEDMPSPQKDRRPKASARLIPLPNRRESLYCQILHYFPELLNLISYITLWIRADDGRSNDGALNATCSSKSCFARDKYIWNVLIFANAWERHEQSERNRILGHNDYLTQTAAEGFHNYGGKVNMMYGVREKYFDLLSFTPFFICFNSVRFPFLPCFKWVSCCRVSRRSCVRVSSAIGQAKQMSVGGFCCARAIETYLQCQIPWCVKIPTWWIKVNCQTKNRFIVSCVERNRGVQRWARRQERPRDHHHYTFSPAAL